MKKIQFLLILLVILLCSACSSSGGREDVSEDQITLILAAYTTPREAYSEIIPLFQTYWEQETGQQVIFEESYQGSGAQSRAVVEGFEADIVALSLEADVIRIQEAGLISHDWKAGKFNGMVSTSIVAFAVRPGNPLNIQDWDDLSQPDVEILTPNPQTSGGAMWNVLAMYGAAIRGQIENIPADDPNAATAFLVDLLQNVTALDKSARDSIINFENGIGNVAITYENEVLVGRLSGQTYELVIPHSTILIENPVAVVDANVDAHGNREAAEAFVAFLFTREAQEIFSRYGLRAVDPDVAAARADDYPPVADLFSIDFFGGWDQATPEFFGEDGIFTQAILQVQDGD